MSETDLDKCCGSITPLENCVCLTFKSGLYTISFTLTALGIGFIFFTVYILRIPRTPLTTMILGISICDLVFTGSIFSLRYIHNLNQALCQGFLLASQIGVNASFTWAVCFTHACRDLIKNEHNTRIHKNMKYYVLITLIASLCSSILAIYQGFVYYYADGDTCVHIVNIGKFDLSAFIGVNVHFILAVILSIYFSVHSIKGLNRIFGGGDFYRWLVILKYPGALIICWVPLQLGLLLLQAGTTITNNNLAVLIEVIVLCQGFINAIVYGVSRRTLIGFKDLCRRWCMKGERSSTSSKHAANISLGEELIGKYESNGSSAKVETLLHNIQ